MIETFLFVRLSEGEVCWNVAWKFQKCCEVVGGGDVDVTPDYTFFGRNIWMVYLACFLVSLG